MTEYLHSLDATRPVTCGINIFFNFLSSIGFGVYSDKKAKKEANRSGGKKKAVGSEFFNNLAGIFGSKTMKIGATLHGCDVKQEMLLPIWILQDTTMVSTAMEKI